MELKEAYDQAEDNDFLQCEVDINNDLTKTYKCQKFMIKGDDISGDLAVSDEWVVIKGTKIMTAREWLVRSKIDPDSTELVFHSGNIIKAYETGGENEKLKYSELIESLENLFQAELPGIGYSRFDELREAYAKFKETS